jgi:hypothetical protein
MSDTSLANRPAVEPVPDRPSIGLLTKTGFGTAIVMAVLALIDAIVGDSIDADTRLLIATSVASVIATILARGYQAGQLIAAKYGVKLPDQPLR